MASFRTFHNADPPALASIWASSPLMRGVAPRITSDVFDNLVLAKPYFDPEGLILATVDDRPVGFVHAGFGPTSDLSDLDKNRGVISMLMVKDGPDAAQISNELIERAEGYLRAAGSDEALAIGVGPVCPFYLGLYGGSDLPGILDSDPVRGEVFRAAGYEEADRVLVFQRDLTGFRPQVDRAQVKIGRASSVDILFDPAPLSWWEACTRSCFDQVRVELRPREGGSPVAYASFWDIGEIAAGWGFPAMGLSRIEVEQSVRVEGRATYLLGESLRQLYGQGVRCVEAQTMQDDEPTIKLFAKLGFIQVDAGSVLMKLLE